MDLYKKVGEIYKAINGGDVSKLNKLLVNEKRINVRYRGKLGTSIMDIAEKKNNTKIIWTLKKYEKKKKTNKKAIHRTKPDDRKIKTNKRIVFNWNNPNTHPLQCVVYKAINYGELHTLSFVLYKWGINVIQLMYDYAKQALNDKTIGMKKYSELIIILDHYKVFNENKIERKQYKF